MSKPKLYYFDLSSSRGEECRLALVLAGVDFDDVRVPREAWPELKKSLAPFGTMPFLSVDDQPPLGQTNAILGYIARQHGLRPSSPWQAARHDALMDYVEDLRNRIMKVVRQEGDKQQLREDMARGDLQTWAGYIEAQLEGPFAFGAAACVADIKLYMLSRWLRGGVIDHVPTTVLDAFPKLVSLQENLAQLPEISAFLNRA